jgi:hypothetical protein
MVNPEKVAADALARAKSNGSTLATFFKPKEKPAEPPARGRPPKALETRGRRPASALAAPTGTASPANTTIMPAAPAATAPSTAAPKKRTNWAVGPDAAKLAQAVKEWSEKSGRAAEREFLGETKIRNPSMREFCTMVDIPFGAFASYATSING